MHTASSFSPKGTDYLHLQRPNVVVEWLTLLLHIREVSVSIFGPGDRLPIFRGFPQSLQANAGIVGLP
jgi:hypothetical protein